MNIIKRDGTEAVFSVEKITKAISKANADIDSLYRISEEQIHSITRAATDSIMSLKTTPTVEQIQNIIENKLMDIKAYNLVRAYNNYRYQHELDRHGLAFDSRLLTILDGTNEEVLQENSNKDPRMAAVQRDYLASEVSEDIAKRLIFSKEEIEAHKQGIIHIHDLGYAASKIFNCCLVNLDDMLQNGTVITGTMIEKPKSFSVACTIATQIIGQIASAQYGGQTISLSHLSPFVDVSRQKFKKQLELQQQELGIKYTSEQFNALLERMVKRDVEIGIQTIQYQVTTMMTSNGQAAFLSIFMCLGEKPEGQERDDLALVIEEVLKQRILGTKNVQGVYVAPAFPKLLYVLDEYNTKEDSPYFYLTKLSAECTTKRMVPDYISAKKMREYKKDQVYACMGCRSFLTAEPHIINDDGTMKFYGRFNMGVCTINLVDVALSSRRDIASFWAILDERLELCHNVLKKRIARLKGTKAEVSPIHWMYGAIARLKKGETIDHLLESGYATISLGYAGLFECIYYLFGKSHTDPKVKTFALSVMKKLNDKCKEWRDNEGYAYSVYGTPIETTTYRFAKCLKNRFGNIEGVTDKNYITNSYHINVKEEISIFEKFKIEADFQQLSPGGCISYGECPNMVNNQEAVIKILQYIYETIMYAELNMKLDHCQQCGYEGEIEIKEDTNKKLYWKCPSCGNTDEKTMNIARRVCGYISSNGFNQGRTQEIKERVLHI